MKLAVLALVLALAFPLSAQALNKSSSWATSGNPLIRDYGGSLGYGYGSFSATQTSDGTQMYTRGYLRLLGPKRKYPTYFSSLSQYNSGRCAAGRSFGFEYGGTGGSYGEIYSCTQAFYSAEHVNSANVSRSDYTFKSRYHRVKDTASVGRAAVRVCIAVPMAPDYCTGRNYSGADNW